jgi:uroporphyrinogen decarboxylase
MVDIIEWGDDVAMQQGPLFSPDTYRKMIKPTHLKMMAALKSKSDAHVVYHSCGSVAVFIEDLIEIGVDALNPVQVSAKNMNPSDLKENYGNRISFWGGIDTHHVLPAGTTTEVREEVRRICKILGRDGGYILAAVHNIQQDVPPENVATMLEAGLKYGQY